MENIIKAIQLSLQTENYTAALMISLTLPDICGKMEGKADSSDRYIEWFDKYMKEKYDGYLSAKDCYAIRCAVLHAASDDIIEQSKHEILEKFYFLTRGAHCNRFSNIGFGDPNYDNKETLQLSVYDFCSDFLEGLKKWLIDISTDPDIQERITKMFVIHKPGEGIGGIKFV